MNLLVFIVVYFPTVKTDEIACILFRLYLFYTNSIFTKGNKKPKKIVITKIKRND